MGFEKYVEKQMLEEEKEEEGKIVTINVWYSNGGIGPVPTIGKKDFKSWEAKRIRVLGGVQRKGREDREMCFDEFLGGLW